MKDNKIKYSNREFNGLRQDLIDYAKTYFPATYNDFSETSPGMMFIEMIAYVGDVLSFYQDSQLQETFLQYAKDPKNLYTLAYTLGYRPKSTTAATTLLEVSQTVPATLSEEPDYAAAESLPPNTTIFSSTNPNVPFTILRGVDFNSSTSLDPIEITPNFDGLGNLEDFTITKTVEAVSGEVEEFVHTVDSTEPYHTFFIEDSDIIGVIDIIDNLSNEWIEVPFLGQDTILNSTSNTNPDSEQVSSILEVEKAPRRFVTRYNTQGELEIQFGTGIYSNEQEDSFIPSPANIGLGGNDLDSKLRENYDPSNFLFTRSYGLIPTANTELTVRYLKGGGVQSNIDSGTISTTLTVGTTPIEIVNITPATGGRGGDTAQELRENIQRTFQEQGRLVSPQDFALRAKTLPSEYGVIEKAYATPRSNVEGNYTNPLEILLYVLSLDSDGKLTPSTSTLKENLRKYLSQYVLLTQSISIRDAFIVNIGVTFEIVVLPNTVGREVIFRCMEAVEDYFDIGNWTINKPVNINELYTILDKVKGVQTVKDISIKNITGTKNGRVYSESSYDISSAMRSNILYPSLDPCVFEVKYPQYDIQGRITTL